MEADMRLTWLATLLALTGLATISAGSASAQIYSPYRQPYFRAGAQIPTLPPALNLLRGTNTPASVAANYFLGTVPEVARRQNTTIFGAAINTLDAQERALEVSVEDRDLTGMTIQSGHRTLTGSTLGYFNNTGGFYPIPGAFSGLGQPLYRPGGGQRR
jgi:hypothetical protein